jgi:hypothetical protein
VLVCATDGFFGYVDTPAQFENMLWDTMASAQDMRHWGSMLTSRVESLTGDDASLALVGLGFDDLADLRAHFAPRARQVRVEHAEPMAHVPPGNRAALVSARERSWQNYRRDYQRRLLLPQGDGR